MCIVLKRGGLFREIIEIIAGIAGTWWSGLNREMVSIVERNSWNKCYWNMAEYVALYVIWKWPVLGGLITGCMVPWSHYNKLTQKHEKLKERFSTTAVFCKCAKYGSTSFY